MIHLVMLALASAAALLQVSVLPALQPEPLAAPLLTVALIAAWSAMRGPAEIWTVLLMGPLVAAALSEERLGWFVLALLPAAVLGAALGPHTTTQPAGRMRRLAIACLIAASGAALHALILALAARAALHPLDATSALISAALWTALFAVLLAIPLRPSQAPERGLFI